MTAGTQNRIWYPSLMNIRIWIWLAMQGLILSCMIHLSVETDFTFSNEKIGDYYTGVRRVLAKIFGNREVLAYVTATEKNMVQNDCFSVLCSRKICRFSVHGRKKHHWTRPEVTVWNTFHCCYIRYAGILKQTTMNRKRSSFFVTIWCEATKGLKCWSIWLTSVIVPWQRP